MWRRMQHVSGCQSWRSSHVSWQPAWGDEKWQTGLGRARPSLLSVPTWLDAKPLIYMDSRATEQKKAFFHQLGRTTGLCKLCVKLRSASQWLNSAHLAALAFKALFFFHDGLTNGVPILVLNSKNYFYAIQFEIIYPPTYPPTHQSTHLPIHLSTQPSVLSWPNHIAVYTAICTAIYIPTKTSTYPAIYFSTSTCTIYPSTYLSIYFIYPYI